MNENENERTRGPLLIHTRVSGVLELRAEGSGCRPVVVAEVYRAADAEHLAALWNKAETAPGAETNANG